MPKLIIVAGKVENNFSNSIDEGLGRDSICGDKQLICYSLKKSHDCFGTACGRCYKPF